MEYDIMNVLLFFVGEGREDMISRKTAATGLLSFILMGTTAFAEPATFQNSEPKNWDFPAKGKLEASKSESGILITEAHAEWSSKQIDLFRHADYVRFPALSIQTDSSTDELQPKVMITDLPGAKFEIGPANDSDLSGIEITVFSLAASKMVGDKPYEFYTAWMQTGKDSPGVTLHSLQRYGGQSGGMYRDLPDTDDLLAKSKWDEAEVSKWERTTSLQDNGLKFSGNVTVPEPAEYKRIKSDYSYIHSKEALEQYKKEADKKLEDSFRQAYPQFAATFTPALSLEQLEKMIREYGIEVSQVYAIGTTSDNREYTVSWFHTDPKLLSSLSFDMRFKGFGITELEGRASEANVKKMRSDFFVGTIEVEEQNRRPTGIHWLNKLYDGFKLKNPLVD